MDSHEAHRLRRRLVREHIAPRGVRRPDVLAAMRTVPRHLFVPEAQRGRAYQDRPLPIDAEQTISQPYVVAAMTELLDVGAGDHVLEIGTGSGYQAAVLAEVCSRVTTVELIEELAEQARRRLAELHYRNVTVRQGDGALGWPDEAPYDGIVVTCGAKRTPPALLEQLAPGRRMVVPVGPPGEVMELRVWEKELDGRLRHRDAFQVRFVPMVSEAV
ncbi:MAG: protein-L-isoaspartate(D-aspartate) O-methyltransferase [Planctomycetota bacterium]|nr:MAG: protein-L-isoaspartate(D-aspartate) O-methyltransferase [Planctomycetota bacterium]